MDCLYLPFQFAKPLTSLLILCFFCLHFKHYMLAIHGSTLCPGCGCDFWLDLPPLGLWPERCHEHQRCHLSPDHQRHLHQHVRSGQCKCTVWRCRGNWDMAWATCVSELRIKHSRNCMYSFHSFSTCFQVWNDHEFLIIMGSIDLEFWCCDSSAVWPRETDCHVVNERWLSYREWTRKRFLLDTGSTNARKLFTWLIAADEIGKKSLKKPVDPSQTSSKCQNFLDKINPGLRFKTLKKSCQSTW